MCRRGEKEEEEDGKTHLEIMSLEGRKKKKRGRKPESIAP